MKPEDGGKMNPHVEFLQWMRGDSWILSGRGTRMDFWFKAVFLFEAESEDADQTLRVRPCKGKHPTTAWIRRETI